jgi:protein TonB
LTAAPPPPPPPAGSSKPKTEKKVVRKTKDLVQPDPEKKVEVTSDSEAEDQGVEGGVEGGVVGGEIGGVLGGEIGGVIDAPPPPPKEEPQIVPQAALEAQRISGEKNIQPPNDVATAISRSGTKATGVFKLCLNNGGGIQSIKMLKSTGYPAYDNKIKSTMNSWKYRPLMVNGKAVPVCTSVTFIFTPQ